MNALALTFGLGSALVWSFAVILYRICAEKVHPALLNFIKNLFALACFSLTVWLGQEKFPSHLTTQEIGLLALSGFLGIGLADYLFLIAINILGASRAAIVETIYSPSVIFLSYLIWGDKISLVQGLGISIIIIALIYVSYEKAQPLKENQESRQLMKGMAAGLLAVFIVAVGIIIIRPIIPKANIFWILELRIMAGLLCSCLILLFNRDLSGKIQQFMAVKKKSIFLLASFCGTYLTLILWLEGYKHGQAAVVAVLNQMATFFIVILAAIFLQEKLTKQKVLGTVLAFVGVGILIFF